MEQDGRKKTRPDGFSLSNLRCLVLNHRSDIGCNKLNIKVTSYNPLKIKTINKDYSNHIRYKYFFKGEPANSRHKGKKAKKERSVPPHLAIG